MNVVGRRAFVVAVVALALTPASTSAAIAPQATDLLARVNAVRAQHHLRALRNTTALDRSAAMKAQRIVSCGAFSHTPCGTPFTRTFQAVGYFRGHAAVGENLFWGTSSLGTPQEAMLQWLHSPPHRANLLGAWRDAGIAVVHAQQLFGQSDVWLYVMQFGRRG